MSYKNLSEGLSRDNMKNTMANPIKPMKRFFRSIVNYYDVIILVMIIIIGAVAVFGVYFDWLKL